MKLLRPRTFVIFAFVGLSGAMLLNTSQNVQHAEERLQELELAKYREQEKIRMLKAEWESLNRPERLEKLAHEFLDLVPPTPEQMATDREALPEPIQEEVEEFESYDQPVLQHVSVKAPIPRPKPQRIIPQKTSGPKKEKGFGELLDELGGGQ